MYEIYKPSAEILNKLVRYRDTETHVNVKAIKSMDKLFTYYYGALLLKWNTLEYDIRMRMLCTPDYEVLRAMEKNVSPDSTYADKRSEEMRRFNSWIPKLAKVLYGTSYTVDKRTPSRMECAKDMHNGLSCTLGYTLHIADKDFDIAVHTNENDRGATYGYIIDRREMTSQKALIDYIKNHINIVL